MKKLFIPFAFSILATAFISCNDDDDNVISAENLPQAGKTFLNTYFESENVVRVEKNAPAESDGTVYEVNLTNGYEVDFTEEGSWVNVSQNNDTKSIPTGFINEKIVLYSTTNYPNAQINSIEKENNYYEVELTNTLDLIFDLEGNFLRINY